MQTKLTKAQKAELKTMREMADQSQIEIHHRSEMGVCVVLKRNPGFGAHVAWSVKSEGENRYRRKVAEYVALNRFFDGVYLPLANVDNGYNEVADTIESLAITIVNA